MLVLIRCDPRRTGRAFEAMRIGVGIVAGDNPVTFVLTDGAVHLLDEDTEALVDGDEIARFRTTLQQLGVPFHVEVSAIPDDPGWNPDRHPVVPVTPAEIAELVAGARRFIVF